MKGNKLEIRINRPVSEVFKFLLDPKNTPLWVDSFVKEEVNEVPTKLGTVYRNQDKSGRWSEYSITDYEENEMFEFTAKDGNYSVRYTFHPVDDNTTELEYVEWVRKGKPEKPFTIEVLQKLKSILESLT